MEDSDDRSDEAVSVIVYSCIVDLIRCGEFTRCDYFVAVLRTIAERTECRGSPIMRGSKGKWIWKEFFLRAGFLLADRVGLVPYYFLGPYL